MKKLVITILTLVMFVVGAQGVWAQTGINRKINFQGKVVNKGVGGTDGTNVPDGNYDFKFSLWNTLEAGSSIWSESWTGGSQVAVNSGIFSVVLGTNTTLGAIDFNNPNIYLSVNYDNDGEMAPRIQMAAVPFAFNAEKVNGLTVTNTTGVLSIGASKTITFGDNFTTTGVGITLDQSLATSDSVTFAGLSVGSTVTFSNIPVAVGTTVLFIDATGKLSKGYIAGGVGTTYAFTNGLTDLGSQVIGLGGSLTANTQIGTSDFNLSFIGLGGTQGLYLSSTGTVGIGTTNPNYFLTVNGDILSTRNIYFGQGTGTWSFNTTNNDGFYVNSDLRNMSMVVDNVEILTVTMANRVGIGTTGPDYKLEVAGDVLISDRLGIGATNVNFALNVGSSAVNFGGNLSVGGTVAFTNIAKGTGTTILYIDAGGNIVSGTLPVYMAINGLNLNGTVFELGSSLTRATTIGTSSHSLSFLGLGGTQALFIGASGYVGIGTTNPNYILDVGTTARMGPILFGNLQKAYGQLISPDDYGNGLLIRAGDEVCFGKETVISTANGGLTIDKIEVGDQILGYDPESMTFVTNTVRETFIRESPDYFIINGITKVTPEHPIYTKFGWKQVKDLIIGDQIFSDNGKWKTLISLEYVKEKLMVYNMHTDNPHTYFADGMLAHNMCVPGPGGDLTLNPGYTNIYGNIYMATLGGKVGIGTTNPLYELQVAGDGYFSTNLSVGGSLTFTGLVSGVGTTILYIDASGNIVSGTLPTVNLANSKVIVLSPEYPGASLSADGSGTTAVSMTSDNTLNAGGVGWKNYYELKSTEATLQDYSVITRITLPSDFDTWETGSCPGDTCALEINYQTGLATTADNFVSAILSNDADTPGTAVCTIGSTASTAWSSSGCTEAVLNDASAPEWDSAGETAVIRIKMAAKNTGSALVRAGDIILRYKSKF